MEIESNINKEILKKEKENVQVNKALLIKGEQPRKAMVKYKSYYINIRNSKEALYAKERANWKCEFNEQHITFSTNSGKQYVETHHLIPLSFQKSFDSNIDFADNLVSLCPICHRLLHYATIEEKEPILKELFNNRQDKYSKYGIAITFDQLLDCYK